MHQIAAAILMAFSFTTPALADSTDVAENLGMMLASEEPCGLAFSPEAINAFIERNVAGEDMEFTGWLSHETRMGKHMIDGMSPSGLQAHCTQARRVGESYNLLK